MSQVLPPYFQQLLNPDRENSCTQQKNSYNEIVKSFGKDQWVPHRFGIAKLDEIVNIYCSSEEFLKQETLTDEQVDFVLKKFQSSIIESIKILFNNCDLALITELSAEPYEKKAVHDMAIAILNQEQIKHISTLTIVQPDIEFNAANVHHIRKLLSITENKNDESINCCLVLKNENGKISTLGFADRKEIAKKFPIINLIGHMNWTVDIPPLFDCTALNFDDWYEMSPETRCIARYEKGRIFLPVAGNDIKGFLKEKLADCIDEKQICKISKYIETFSNTVKKQKKGTSVIFLPKELAENEKNRLFPLKRLYIPSDFLFDSIENTLFKFSNIDGTNFIDYETGKYVAFGVLLDGNANIECDLSKGARHSSVLTYLNQFNSRKPILAFVLSEDGGHKIFIKNFDSEAAEIS